MSRRHTSESEKPRQMWKADGAFAVLRPHWRSIAVLSVLLVTLAVIVRAAFVLVTLAGDLVTLYLELAQQHIELMELYVQVTSVPSVP